jgi:hypothetical protein
VATHVEESLSLRWVDRVTLVHVWDLGEMLEMLGLLIDSRILIWKNL